MDSILDDPAQIKGEIYLIEHIASSKKYVGQTLSHRKNHGRYRPFHYTGRFRDHISEALNNTKLKQCTYLNNAIRLYGADAFRVQLLEECERDVLDLREIHYITEHNSLFPHGYNLTKGGKGAKSITTIDNSTSMKPPRKRGGCLFRSPETRLKMSMRTKAHLQTADGKTERMINAQKQHLAQKIERFKHVTIDKTNLDKYIRVGKHVVYVSVDDQQTQFVGKYESEEALVQKAKEFLLSITATLPNCSGNP